MRVAVTKAEEAEMGSEGREVLVRRRAGGREGEGGGYSKDGDDEPGKMVVVGIKMDTQSRELLTWALVKVAQPGDCVIALHVLPNSSFYEKLDPEGRSSSTSAVGLVKAFDSVLAVYDGFCNLKQIDLKLKICRGSSVRKILVREANSIAASKLIVGIAKNHLSIRSSSTSTAKYCAKKLCRDCAVLAVNNGKIVFQRTENCKANKQSFPANFASKSRQSSDKIFETSDGNLACSLVTKGQEGKNAESQMPSPCFHGKSNSRSDSDGSKDDNTLSHGSVKKSCSICAPFALTCQEGNSPPSTQSGEDESLALVPAKEIESSPSSMSILIHELREVRSGWPLLRKTVLRDKKKGSERSKISVVQWAMRLPSRCSLSASVHPDRKPIKSDANATPNLDSDSGAIVPVGTDASNPSNGIQDEELVELPKELESLHEKYGSTCRLFSYQELMLATSNFSEEKLIGRGGSSRVYRGCLPDGKELAVKILKPSEDALKEFVLEIEIITTLHHENIISLYGFCFENNNLLLVYDFLSRGSLEDNLHSIKDDKYVLGWNERYKVAMGVAEALNYLHSGCSGQPVIHRDVKSSNILLSNNFEPQLSDYGLAKWASSASSQITCSDVAGTFGYLAPEYFMYGKVNEKIDVYAFGVVLLELISGRKPISAVCPKGQESLVMWATPILQSGKAKQLVDPGLGDEYDNDQLELMILAASLCIRRTPRSRPRIAHVLKLLEGDNDVTKWAKSQVSVSEEFDGLDEETAFSVTNIQSHLSLALLDVEDDSLSISSTEQTMDFILAHGSLEDYLQGRWSRSSSFD